MASTPWDKKLKEAQDLTNSGAQSEFANDYSTAFTSYVRAGEIYLYLIKQDGRELDRSRIKAAAEKVLSRAQTIKQIKRDVKAVSRNPLSELEQAKALDAGGFINSVRIPEWKEEHTRNTSRKPVPLPLLAPKQVEQEARFLERKDEPTWSIQPLFDSFRPLRGSNIVQRVVTDCSFVAALEVAAEHDIKWGTKLAHSPLHPKDEVGHPIWSPSKTYNVRLLINGVYRCISVDEQIPCYKNGSPMCAVGKFDQNLQVWPALIEKAYISLKGGYDFKGSNSSIDLHALIGWIPEHIGLQHRSFRREKTWNRIKAAYDKGHLLMTAGTSRFTDQQRMEDQNVLIESHSYAIFSLEERDESQWLTLMNPWENDDQLEIITMSWNEACTRLDSFYLNWSPELFQFNLTWHGCWRGNGKQQSSFVQLKTGEDCEVLLVLTRHATDTIKTNLHKEWIALHVIDAADEPSPGGKSIYVDSPQTTVRLSLSSGTRSVAACREGDAGESSFTLTAHSTSKIEWSEVTKDLGCDQIVKGHWTVKSAGGNVACPNFFTNPQYRLSVKNDCNISVTVETSKDLPVQAVLLWSRGKRVDQIVQGDVITSSNTYSYGLAMTEQVSIKAGEYTLLVSTFEQGRIGEFDFKVQSDQPLQLTNIESEGAGMFHQSYRASWDAMNAFGRPKNTDYFRNPTWQLDIEQSSIFLLRMQAIVDTGKPQAAINLAIFRKGSKTEIMSSGAYSDTICGVSIDKTRLDPGKYLLVASTYDAGVTANLKIDMYSDRRIICKRISV